MGSNAYHTETKQTRLLVKKERCFKEFVDDGGLGIALAEEDKAQHDPSTGMSSCNRGEVAR
jgi:hypothetical protein